MAFVASGGEVVELLTKFGVPDAAKCKRVTIDFPACDVVTTTVVYYAEMKDLVSGVGEIVKKYKLVPIE